MDKTLGLSSCRRQKFFCLEDADRSYHHLNRRGIVSVILIPNQNVVFFSGLDFNARNKLCTLDVRTYCQPVQYETATQFQVQTSGITGFNLITNGNFNVDLTDWTVGANGGWTWNSQTALLNSVSSTFKTLTQTGIVTEVGRDYKVCFTVTGYVAGSVSIIGGAAALDSAGVILPGSGVTIDGNGDFCLFFTATTATSQVQFNTIFEIIFRIDDVTMASQSTVELLDVTVEDCDGNFEKDVDDVSVVGDTTTITVDWTDLLAGCHRICITGIGDTAFNFLTSGYKLLTESGGTLLKEDGGRIRWV